MRTDTPTFLDPNPETGDPSTLSAADEATLLRRIDAGVIADAALRGWRPTPPGASTAELRLVAAEGECARLEMAAANTGLVWWLVHPIARASGRDRDELFQEGVVGLMEAIQRFDPTRGRFATYAVPRIRMRVWDAAVTAHGSLGLPARRARQWRRARALSAQLTVTLSRAPRIEELARETGESVAVVRSLLAFVPPVTLAPDAPGWDDVAPARSQGAASEDVDREAVLRLLRRLGTFDRAMVARLYGLDGPAHSHAEVARDLGRSESTIRRRERRALELLRAGTPEWLAA